MTNQPASCIQAPRNPLVALARRLYGGAHRRWLKWTRYRAPTPQRSYVYKTVGEVELCLHVFEPKQPHKPLPVILLFHGGGWFDGSPRMIFPECKHFASLGMVAISAQYRMLQTHGTSPFESIADAKSAIRWVRRHATELQVNPDLIVAGGTSAGGHLAISLCLFDGIDGEDNDPSIPCAPQGLILWNPVLDSTMTGYVHGAKRLQDRAVEISPVHHLRSGLPPCIIFHATGDQCTPYECSARFESLSRELGNPCQLVTFEGRRHGFHQHTSVVGYVDDNNDFNACMAEADGFLLSLGCMPQKQPR
jgi:acetyl esterase